MSRYILCDGDCGDVWDEKYMNYTPEGYKFCKECMFTFTAEKKNEEHQP